MVQNIQQANRSQQTAKRYYDNESDIEQLERYKLLVESVEDYAIFLLDTEGFIASWNPGAEKFKGYKPKEIIGKHFSVFYRPEEQAAKKPEIELEVSKKEGRIEDEGWRVRKDGSHFWANVVITALYDKSGRHRGFAKVTRDLTERKMYEDELRDNNKELLLLNSLKDDFVSLASHQLRTPATGVKQYLGLLLEGYAGPLTEQQEDFLQKAYTSNDRQLDIVNDLLQIAQLDAGKIKLNKQIIDINELIADIIDEQIDSFKNRGQQLKLVLAKRSQQAAIDPQRLRMVVENLIDNASKYTPEKGTITVSVRAHKKSVAIIVEDTGVGISEFDLPKLFHKFSRIPNELSSSSSGSGLGLFWAKQIIDMHEGTIEVSSETGKGTKFTITLPI